MTNMLIGVVIGLVVAWFFLPAPAFMQRLYVRLGFSSGTTKAPDTE